MLPLVLALPACWFLFIALRCTRPRLRPFVSPAPPTPLVSSSSIVVSPPWSLHLSTRALNNVPTQLLSFFLLTARWQQAHIEVERTMRLSGRLDTGTVRRQSRRLDRSARRARPSYSQSSTSGGTRRNRHTGAAYTRRYSAAGISKIKRAAIPPSRAAAGGGTDPYSASSE